MPGYMARYNRMVRASFAAEDRKAAEGRAYARKHGLVRRGQELRLVYLRQIYARYLPDLDSPSLLARNHAGRELAKIGREAAKLVRLLRTEGHDGTSEPGARLPGR